jgi:hypothetical protein
LLVNLNRATDHSKPPKEQEVRCAGLAVRDVLIQRLNQGEPGQLGKVARRMADAGVNIEIQYSDHANQLILVVDNLAAGRAVSETWTREQSARGRS